MSRRSLFARWLKRPAGPSSHPDEACTQVEAANGLPGFLRPPGARPEDKFLELCERCTDCRDACPYTVILHLGPAYGEAEGTPAILPQDDACRLCADLPCISACPSGALQPVPREEVNMGLARLDPLLCLAVQGEGCDSCVGSCPLGEKALRWAVDRPEILAAGCTGCGMCVEICPARPRALTVDPAVS